MFVSKRKFTDLSGKVAALHRAVLCHNEAMARQADINDCDADGIDGLAGQVKRVIAINEKLAGTLAIMRSMHSLAADINLTHAEAIDVLFQAVANLEAVVYDTPKPAKAPVSARTQHPSNVSKKA